METHSSKTKPLFEKVQKGIFLVGFSVLSGFFGLGLTWLGVGVVASVLCKTSDQFFDVAARCLPLLIVGGIAGFIAGLIISLKVARRDQGVVAKMEKRYVGGVGRVDIYMGIPALVAVLLTPLFGRVSKLVGQKYDFYVILGIILVIIGTYLYLLNWIPKKCALPMGIAGWLISLSLVLWYCFLGPGAFGHAHF